MANPVTQALLKQIEDDEIAEFVARWDELEELVIAVYRVEAALPRDEDGYRRLQEWLKTHYPHWQAALRPYWERTRVAGNVTRKDPFAGLIEADHARDFVGNWPAMQTLPAARQALNEWLMNMLDE